MLEALGTDRADYFSLDVEGAELYVLQSIDWPRVVIERHPCIYAVEGLPPRRARAARDRRAPGRAPAVAVVTRASCC